MSTKNTAPKNAPENWAGLIGQYVQVETSDGVYREGKITGVDFFDFFVGEETWRLPVTIQLNNDSTDRIDFKQLRAMKLRA